MERVKPDCIPYPVLPELSVCGEGGRKSQVQEEGGGGVKMCLRFSSSLSVLL